MGHGTRGIVSAGDASGNSPDTSAGALVECTGRGVESCCSGLPNLPGTTSGKCTVATKVRTIPLLRSLWKPHRYDAWIEDKTDCARGNFGYFLWRGGLDRRRECGVAASTSSWYLAVPIRKEVIKTL